MRLFQNTQEPSRTGRVKPTMPRELWRAGREPEPGPSGSAGPGFCPRRPHLWEARRTTFSISRCNSSRRRRAPDGTRLGWAGQAALPLPNARSQAPRGASRAWWPLRGPSGIRLPEPVFPCSRLAAFNYPGAPAQALDQMETIKLCSQKKKKKKVWA